MKTHNVKQSELKRDWVVVDAAGQVVGRLASEVARILRGKHKPTFTTNLDCGDSVIVINADKVRFTGSKWTDKHYHQHSLYIGGLKTTSAKDLLSSNPERIIEIAVQGMMPKSKLGKAMLKHLRVYKGSEHGQEAQKPIPAKARTQV